VPRLEAILFVAGRPLSPGELASAVGSDKKSVEAALAEICERHRSSGLRLQRDGRSAQFVSAPEAAADVERFLGLEATSHLSGPALETLAIVAYRQPVTRPEIEELRGVNCDAVIRTLMVRGLVVEVARRQTVGLPIEYGTTFRFLEYFGLSDLSELPDVGAVNLGAAAAQMPAPMQVELLAPPARPVVLPAEFRAAIGAVHANGVGDD
jgi:segregation and condensation protein B